MEAAEGGGLRVPLSFGRGRSAEGLTEGGGMRVLDVGFGGGGRMENEGCVGAELDDSEVWVADFGGGGMASLAAPLLVSLSGFSEPDELLSLMCVSSRLNCGTLEAPFAIRISGRSFSGDVSPSFLRSSRIASSFKGGDGERRDCEGLSLESRVKSS